MIGKDSVDWGLWSVSLTICKFLIWKHNWLLWDETEWDSGIVGSSELVLVTSIDGTTLEGHLVEFLEVTWILGSLL